MPLLPPLPVAVLRRVESFLIELDPARPNYGEGDAPARKRRGKGSSSKKWGAQAQPRRPAAPMPQRREDVRQKARRAAELWAGAFVAVRFAPAFSSLLLGRLADAAQAGAVCWQDLCTEVLCTGPREVARSSAHVIYLSCLASREAAPPSMARNVFAGLSAFALAAWQSEEQAQKLAAQKAAERIAKQRAKCAGDVGSAAALSAQIAETGNRLSQAEYSAYILPCHGGLWFVLPLLLEICESSTFRLLVREASPEPAALLRILREACGAMSSLIQQAHRWRGAFLGLGRDAGPLLSRQLGAVSGDVGCVRGEGRGALPGGGGPRPGRRIICGGVLPQIR